MFTEHAINITHKLKFHSSDHMALCDKNFNCSTFASQPLQVAVYAIIMQKDCAACPVIKE